MDEIKNIVNQVIGDIAENAPDTYNKIERIWQNLLTEQEFRHTKIIGVKKETISVCVDSPAWLYQMRTKQHKILKQLKEDVPDIKHIQFKIGAIKP